MKWSLTAYHFSARSPLPVPREGVRVWVISYFERFSLFEITLTPALSRATGRGRKNADAVQFDNMITMAAERSTSLIIVSVLVVAGGLIALAVTHHSPSKIAQSVVHPATRPVVATTTTHGTSRPIPPVDYMAVIHSAFPDYPTTQSLPIPLPLSECARLVLPDPMYLDSNGELWITRPDAKPLAEELKKPSDDFVHIVRDHVLFVHHQLNDAGQWLLQVVYRRTDGATALMTVDGELLLTSDPTAHWDRASEWNTTEVQGFVVPSDDGVNLIRPRSLPIESPVGFDLHRKSQPVTLLDSRGLLAWVPTESGHDGSVGAVRFVDGAWRRLGVAEDWPTKIVQLVPLLDGTVIQVILQDDGTVAVRTTKLDSIAIDPKTVAPVIDRLSDPDPNVRDAAGAELSRYGPGLWPILEKAMADQPPEGQSRIEQLLAQRNHPTLGGMTLLPGTVQSLGRFADGGALMRATAGVEVPNGNPDFAPLVIAPADVLFDPGRAVTLANHFLTADLASDAIISRAPDEWIVSDRANGPRRFLGNHFEPLLKASEKSFSEFVGIDRRGRWLFRKPSSLTPTLVLDPTLPDVSPMLAAWIDPAKADGVGWDDQQWPVVIKGKSAWALRADDWAMVSAARGAAPYHTALATPPTTRPDRPLLQESYGSIYSGGLTELVLSRPHLHDLRWPLPPEAVGSMPPFLIRAADRRLYLFNEPGRVVRLIERDTSKPEERFKIEAIFTRQIPNTALTRAWLDPAGRIDLASGTTHLTVLFPDGRIPPAIAEKMPAEQIDADRSP